MTKVGAALSRLPFFNVGSNRRTRTQKLVRQRPTHPRRSVKHPAHPHHPPRKQKRPLRQIPFHLFPSPFVHLVPRKHPPPRRVPALQHPDRRHSHISPSLRPHIPIHPSPFTFHPSPFSLHSSPFPTIKSSDLGAPPGDLLELWFAPAELRKPGSRRSYSLVKHFLKLALDEVHVSKLRERPAPVAL